MRTKPLLFAVALALGSSAPAFAGSDTTGKAAESTNSRTAPQVLGTGQTAPVTSDSGAPVTSGTTVYSAPADTRVMRSDDAREHALRGDDDASERAARNARATEEEEHGGLRNRMHDKKDRARAKAGLGHDD